MKVCWFWRHKYDKWRLLDEGPTSLADEVTRMIGTHDGTRKQIIGWWQRQARTCQACGWRQVKETVTR